MTVNKERRLFVIEIPGSGELNYIPLERASELRKARVRVGREGDYHYCSLLTLYVNELFEIRKTLVPDIFQRVDRMTLLQEVREEIQTLPRIEEYKYYRQLENFYQRELKQA